MTQVITILAVLMVLALMCLYPKTTLRWVIGLSALALLVWCLGGFLMR